jgi:hypothetical protein
MHRLFIAAVFHCLLMTRMLDRQPAVGKGCIYEKYESHKDTDMAANRKPSKAKQ